MDLSEKDNLLKEPNIAYEKEDPGYAAFLFYLTDSKTKSKLPEFWEEFYKMQVAKTKDEKNRSNKIKIKLFLAENDSELVKRLLEFLKI